jgi:hypothetical protein
MFRFTPYLLSYIAYFFRFFVNDKNDIKNIYKKYIFYRFGDFSEFAKVLSFCHCSCRPPYLAALFSPHGCPGAIPQRGFAPGP